MIAVYLSLMCGAHIHQTPSVASLEKAALAQRRSITSGNVVLESKIWSFPGNKRRLSYVRSTEIWFDGDRIRGDVFQPSIPGPSFDGPTRRWISIFTNDRRVDWIHESTSGPWVATVKPRAKAHEERSDWVLNPRLLGMATEVASNLVYYDLESYVGRPDRSNMHIEEDAVNGLACWRVSYDASADASVKVWYSPFHDGAVLRMKNEFKNLGDERNSEIRTVETDLGLFRKRGHQKRWGIE